MNYLTTPVGLEKFCFYNKSEGLEINLRGRERRERERVNRSVISLSRRKLSGSEITTESEERGRVEGFHGKKRKKKKRKITSPR